MKSFARIAEVDAGKVICREAERLKSAAVVMGTRGRGILQRFVFVLCSTVFPFCFRFFSCACAPVRLLCMTYAFASCFISVLQGSVSEFCFHHCKVAPIIIVPGKGIPELPEGLNF